MILPKHKATLYLTHNEHKSDYQSVKQRIEHEHFSLDDDCFVSDEDKQKCIDTDELWELQWYPDTPIGFYKVCGSSLQVVLEKAMELDKEVVHE